MSRELIPAERIETKILLVRGQKVMLDRDLALLYGVNTSLLKRAVMRNAERFPGDFMFLLNNQELTTLRCQFGTSKKDPRGGVRYAPMAFTEQGVAMLSGVLNSPRATQVNIAIIRREACGRWGRAATVRPHRRKEQTRGVVQPLGEGRRAAVRRVRRDALIPQQTTQQRTTHPSSPRAQ